MDQNIVDEPAMFVKQGRVMRLPRLSSRGVIRRNVIDKLRCPTPLNLNLAHVAHIKNADTVPHCIVFFQNARVLDGHVPAPEIDHFGVERGMNFEERSSLQFGEASHSDKKHQRNMTRRIPYAGTSGDASEAPYSFNLLNRVLRLIPKISAARVLLFFVCCRVT